MPDLPAREKRMAHGKTTATPRRDTRPLRYLHISTDYRWTGLGAAARFVKVGPGVTYRKVS
jgi:hypothetical protein